MGQIVRYITPVINGKKLEAHRNFSYTLDGAKFDFFVTSTNAVIINELMSGKVALSVDVAGDVFPVYLKAEVGDLVVTSELDEVAHVEVTLVNVIDGGAVTHAKR